MSAAVMTQPIAEASPNFKARLAGVFYLLTIITGASALIFVSGRVISSVLATLCYVAVTLLFYGLFKPVNRNLSLVAALFSLVGCAMGTLGIFKISLPINPLAFFGVYCLLIGYLILESTFLPRILGVLMMIGGVGWLTFLSPSLAKSLSPFNMLPGVLGETALTLWLLVKGVNVERWLEQSGETK